MPKLALRFDMRQSPLCHDTPAARYAAAIEQSVWAEENGFDSIVLSEHHGRDDSYLPSPIVLAAAIASRTSRIRLRIAALVASLHDPLRLAEDLAVLDIVSGGRLDVTIGAGYVPSEFAMFGRDLKRRVRTVEETVAVLKQAWTGEAFDYQGRQVRVRPRPLQRPRPRIDLGGSSQPAGERAARIADGYFPSTPALWQPYRDEVTRLTGEDPGQSPWPGARFVHVAEDPDAAWRVLAPYALHEATDYGRMAAETGASTGFTGVDPDAEQLRASGAYTVLTPNECAAMLRSLRNDEYFIFSPLMGGLPVAMAWSGLRLIETKVLPAIV
jgi:alkanesulfonate monooxygenase SsuD/methylene tetrahydromethanopterin reductase-like flavin-dependent oxidoreductase (luciferase family)